MSPKELGGLSAKCLLHKPEDLNLIPKTHEKSQLHVIPMLDGQDRRVQEDSGGSLGLAT